MKKLFFLIVPKNMRFLYIGKLILNRKKNNNYSSDIIVC